MGKLLLGGSVLATGTGVGLGGAWLGSSKEDSTPKSLEEESKDSTPEVVEVKKCEVFLIKREADSTANVFSDWERQKQEDLTANRNVDFWKSVDEGCKNGKVYVSKLGGVFKYSLEHQSKNWKIVTE
ncbi:hypothetical protein MHF_0636 [Mycoplasma haemofelis Ohio2]|uniref:Uncharacterized protein n=1 Tax=Mycoplasma haemofelis (strain Ohio2) TaxID=859194 RepID=F6FI60_MYCHI|nr:hypothetical protein MHF_0636 [Mycoplasma haemofelis Ohio2]